MIYTSRYRDSGAVTASGAAPVRITVGHPRFRLGYELVGKIEELYPDRAWFGREDFRDLYLARLEEVGVPRIRELLAAFGGDVVLLCFEDVWAGEVCHRRMFAEWWESQTGEVVAELPPGDRGGEVRPASPAVKAKADRLISQSRVRKVEPGRWQVGGDNGLYGVRTIVAEDQEVPVGCECQAYKKDRNTICAHRLAVYMAANGISDTLF